MKNFLFSMLMLTALFSLVACEKQVMEPQSTIENGDLLAKGEEGPSAAKMGPKILLAKDANGNPMIYGQGACVSGTSAYGARYVLDLVTYNYYYLSNWPQGLNLEVQTAGGTPVLAQFDANCLDPDRDRTTINDFVCGSVGFPVSLNPNTSYRLRLHIAGYPASSPWYYFTTPVGPACGM